MKNSHKLAFLLFLLTAFITYPISTKADVDSSCLPTFDPTVDEEITTIMNQNYIPSVTTAVIRNNTVIWAKGYGEQQALETVYMIGSVTKSFVTVAHNFLYMIRLRYFSSLMGI